MPLALNPESLRVLGRIHKDVRHPNFQSLTLGQLKRYVGGDPAAGSPTATLLRLLPPRRFQIRRSLSDLASSGISSGGATGGVCKERGLVHRAMMTRDYWGFQVHEGGLQPSIPTTVEFQGLPPPFGFGSHCLHHCSPRAAQVIRGMLTCRCPLLPPP